MKQKSKWISLRLKGLRHELIFVFALVMVAVLVFLGYLFPAKSSPFELRTYLPYIAGLAIFMIILAFFWIKQMMINPVIKISNEAKRIADGDYTRQIELGREDEIGELGEALNRMTARIKENMQELKVFSEKTEAINEETNKRILSLSSLLQISNLISGNAKLDEIIEASMERCLLAGKMALGCLILKDRQTNEFAVKAVHGAQKNEFAAKGIGSLRLKLGEGLLGRAMLKQESIILDKNSKGTSEEKSFREQFSLKNAVIVPIISREKIHGLLIAGNNKENFLFSSADVELYELLSKQLAIAIENAFLATKVEKLEIIDSLTGLYNNTFIQERLAEEIRRAIGFQRPCAFVLFAVDRFEEYRNAFGQIAGENVLNKISSILKENISEVDKAARFSDHEFALVLPERNKRQAIEIADQIRKKIEYIFSEEKDGKKNLTITGAISENPVDGITASELINKAHHILESAKKQGGNKISYKT